MGGLTTQAIKQGFWRDYSRAVPFRAQVLVSDERSQVLTNSLAIFLTLVGSAGALIWALEFLKGLKWLFITLARLFRRLVRNRHQSQGPIQLQTLRHRGWISEGVGNTVREQGGGLGVIQAAFSHLVREDPSQPSTSGAGQASIIGPGGSSISTAPTPPRGSAAVRFNARQAQRNFAAEPVDFLLVSLALFAVILWLVGVNAAAAFAARVSTGSTAVSSSPHCGIWQASQKADVVTIGRDWEYDAESRAGTYARQCYDAEAGADGCHLYENQSIDFFEVSDVQCPFAGQTCRPGPSSAYKLDTGWLDSKVLGINSKRRHLFRRSTTCSPVSTNETYVRYETDSVGERTARYYYGNIGQSGSWNGQRSPYTWESPEMFEKKISSPTYSVAAFRSTSDRATSYILPEFRVPNTTVTLMIISSGMIFHLTERSDPIFPADRRTKEPVGDSYRWYNSRHHGSVLMCADGFEICSPDNQTCYNWQTRPLPWSVTDSAPSQPPASDEEEAYALLYHAGLHSNTYHAIRSRLAYGLDAQRHVNQHLSTGLAPEQWKSEARLLFQTSLARMQQDVYDIVRGTASHTEGFENSMPPRYRGMCKRVKFQSVGWSNLSLFWLLILPSGAVLLAGSSRRWKGELVAYVVGRKIFAKPAKRLAVMIGNGWTGLRRKCRAFWSSGWFSGWFSGWLLR
ncbi:MAG: hypothetical protein Q9191_005724, partial [Dirinaria sp. TL-2023a]